MSIDYPNRAVWLAKRSNAVAGKRVYGRYLRPMPASGKNRDPGLFHEHRRQKGPLVRATGPGSMNQENEFWALVHEGKEREAVEYYQRCLNINYRKGTPTVSKGMALWMAVHTAQRAA